jgi:hypothetical protein
VRLLEIKGKFEVLEDHNSASGTHKMSQFWKNLLSQQNPGSEIFKQM